MILSVLKSILRPLFPLILRAYFVDRFRYKKTLFLFQGLYKADSGKRFNKLEYRPYIHDWRNLSGLDRHYFYHTAWAARILQENGIKSHTDISSNLRFCGVVSAFVDVDFYEYHPAEIELNGLSVNRADVTGLPFLDNSIDSLSCMHVVEHIGLGRYGDPVDVNGDLKAMKELQRVLKQGGALLFVVPVGQPRIIFNAQRVYSYEMILKTFDKLKLKEFSLIPDNQKDGGLIRNASFEMVKTQNNACGCFLFQK